MNPDRSRWNDKFSARGDVLLEHEPFIVERLAQRPRGTVLDVACGDGRNALVLAELGFEVTAVDLSDVGLARLQCFAEDRALTVTTHAMDLQHGEGLDGLGPFDHVIISHFKPSGSLWTHLPTCLHVGGTLVLSTFNHRQAALGFPRQFCLADRELVTIHPLLHCTEHTRFVRHGRHLDGYVFVRVEHTDRSSAGISRT